jgi:hypothetical protein
MEIRKYLNICDVNEEIEDQKRNLYEHILRIYEKRLPKILLNYKLGRAIAQAVSRRPLTAAARVRAWVNPVGFVVDKVALG